MFHSTYYRLPTTKRSKVVTTVYDFVYERFAPVHKRAIHGFQKQKAIAGSDRIICISESTRRDLLEFSGPSPADRTVGVPAARPRAEGCQHLRHQDGFVSVSWHRAWIT